MKGLKMLIKSTDLTDEWAKSIYEICQQDSTVISMQTCRKIASYFSVISILREGTIIAGYGGDGDDYAEIYQQ